EGGSVVGLGAYDQARTGTSRDTAAGRALRLLGARTILTEDAQSAFAAACVVLLAADRLDDAHRLAEDVTRAGEESGSVLLVCNGLWLQAMALHRRGALADAGACYSSAAAAAAAHGSLTVSGWAGAQYATMLAEHGDGQAAGEVLRRLGLDGPLPDTAHLHEAQLAAGLARVACGQVREGIGEIRAAGRRWEA